MDRIRALEGVRVRSFAISFFAYDHPMTRVPQPRGEPGSLKWIQEAIEHRWSALDQPIMEALGGQQTIRWVSPQADDDFAEYRDGSFLKVLGLARLQSALWKAWLARGPMRPHCKSRLAL